MQKNVLREAINDLGINQNDVIKVVKPIGKDYMQYSNGQFTYLGVKKEDEVVPEDIVHELISGKLNFEIVARGEDKFLVEMRELEDMKNDVSHIDCVTNKINDRLDKIENNLSDISEALIENYKQAKQEKEQRKKQELYELIGTGIFFFLVAIILIIKSFI